MRKDVVVGVDGAPPSTLALLWAAEAAHSRRAALDVVYAVEQPMTALDVLYDEAIRRAATEVVDKAAARVRESWPDVPVRVHVVPGPTTRVMARLSRDAALVVVGTQRLTRATRALAGSLSYSIAAASWCPVVVVPSLPDEDRAGVVVGVDGSAHGVRAVALAADEADRTGQELHVVHAFEEPMLLLGADYVPPGFAAELQDAAGVTLGESVAGLAQDRPDLVVHQHLVRGHPATVILDAAAHARLVVVGSRGRTGLARTLLGSVSHDVVLNATCPVMVTRIHKPARSRRGATSSVGARQRSA